MTRDRRIPLPRGQRAQSYQPALASEIDGFYGAAARLGRLDPVVTELVRLRCARHHDCRICKAVRQRDAYEHGVDEEMTAKIDSFETSDLDDRVKVALRYTDAFITQPNGVAGRLATDLLEHFRPDEIVELSLDIMKWSTQKIHVTLGLDVMAGVDVEGDAITFFDLDGSGRPTNFVGAAAPPGSGGHEPARRSSPSPAGSEGDVELAEGSEGEVGMVGEALAGDQS